MPTPSLEKLDLPDRRFEMWGYTVGHSWLMLRSVRTRSARNPDGFAERIDVLFTNVDAISLPTLMDGVTVSMAGPDQAARIVAAGPGMSGPAGQKVFLVRGHDYAGYVIAGALAVTEDQGDYDEPSEFWPP